MKAIKDDHTNAIYANFGPHPRYFYFDTYGLMHYRIIKWDLQNIAVGAIHIGEGHHRVATLKSFRYGQEDAIKLQGHQLSVRGEVS